MSTTSTPDARPLVLESLTGTIIGAFYDVYNALGYGFLESVYANALGVALRELGVRVERERPLDVWYRGVRVGRFRADFVVEGALVVEVKATAALSKADGAQVLNYLRAAGMEVGLLLHFGPEPGVRRVCAGVGARGSGDRGTPRAERHGKG